MLGRMTVINQTFIVFARIAQPSLEKTFILILTSNCLLVRSERFTLLARAPQRSVHSPPVETKRGHMVVQPDQEDHKQSKS